MVLNSSFILKALGSHLINHKGSSTSTFTGVVIDSKKVQPDNIFACIRGEKHDGHQFIPDALSRGATGLIVEKACDVAADIDVFQVTGTLESLRALSGSWREAFTGKVIAVGGSVGKTTTKDMLVSCLSKTFAEVVATRGSENGFLGIPLTLLQITPQTQVAVVEVGIDAPGAMLEHVHLVRPDFALLTAIAEEHLEFLGTIETVAKEELLLLQETEKRGGLSFYNLGDAFIAPHYNASPKKKSFQILNQPPNLADVPQNSLVGFCEQALKVWGEGWDSVAFTSPLPGSHNYSNLLGAIAVAKSLGCQERDIREGILGFQPSGGRSQLETLPGNIEVLCDFYNASPASMKAALKLIYSIYERKKQKGTLWLCLGDMLELGPLEEIFHKNLADLLKVDTPAKVILFGPRMKALEEEITSRFSRNSSIIAQHFTDMEALLSEVVPLVQPNDVLLIKGSRGMKMERIWAALKSAKMH